MSELVENGETYLRPGIDGLDKLSPKMLVMLRNIQESPGLVFVYSTFRSLEGVGIFSKILDFNGYAKYGTNNDLPKYTLYSGTEDQETKKEILRVFTSDDNKYGEKCKILLATAAGAEGLDLKNIRQIHIMEPYWNQVRINQVIGRGNRRGSHMSLPPEERNLEVFMYFSVLGDNKRLSKEKESTDEHIYEISHKKQLIIDEIELLLKESAFDCVLNSADIQGDYRCFSFGEGADGLAYFPRLSYDITVNQRTEKIKKKITLEPVIYHDKKIYGVTKDKKIYLYRGNKKETFDMPSKKTVVYVNPDDYSIYQKDSVKSGNPIRVGYVSKTSSVKKNPDV